MSEKGLYRNMPSVRDIRTLLLHCSLVTTNQQLKHPSKLSLRHLLTRPDT